MPTTVAAELTARAIVDANLERVLNSEPRQGPARRAP
jgi:hypothetical protein